MIHGTSSNLLRRRDRPPPHWPLVPSESRGRGPPAGKGPRPPVRVAKALETFVTHLLLITSHISHTLPKGLPSLATKAAAISGGRIHFRRTKACLLWDKRLYVLPPLCVCMCVRTRMSVCMRACVRGCLSVRACAVTCLCTQHTPAWPFRKRRAWPLVRRRWGGWGWGGGGAFFNHIFLYKF